jgi:hypothetical protein
MEKFAAANALILLMVGEVILGVVLVTRTVPVPLGVEIKEMFGVKPPEDWSGEEAVTAVTKSPRTNGDTHVAIPPTVDRIDPFGPGTSKLTSSVIQ